MEMVNGKLDSHKYGKNGDKSGQFDNFQAKVARKLTKTVLKRDRFYKFQKQTDTDFFIHKENIKSGPAKNLLEPRNITSGHVKVSDHQ